jgi:ABC-2 type transport system permease protein
MWQRIFALMVKEFLTLLKDKKSRFVLVGPPIIQVLIFGYAATFDLNNVPYAVYDEDRGAAAQQLLARLQGSPHFEQVAVINRQDQIAPLIDSREVVRCSVEATSTTRASSKVTGSFMRISMWWSVMAS